MVETAVMGATLDARPLPEAMAEYLEAFRAHREELDSLNVFPVPDGDTGTNLLLTQETVAETAGSVRPDDLPAVVEILIGIE